MNNDNSAERKKHEKRKRAAWYIILALSEITGTFMLVFVVCTSAVPSIFPEPPSLLLVSIVVGIMVAVIIQIFGHISGAHINPAVTLAACVFKEISIPVAALYVVCQFIGGILGYGALLIMTPKAALYINPNITNTTHAFCTTVPNPQITTLQALMSEYAATSVLIFVCCSVWDKRNPSMKDAIPIKFGFTITGLVAAFAAYSGPSLNPARTFGPAIFTGVWDRHWIYWLGPLSASLITALFYKVVFYQDYRPTNPDQAEIPLNQHNSIVPNTEKPVGE